MNFNISRTDNFSKHLKQLAKKYPSIKKDYAVLLSTLQQNPLQGTSLGNNCYKVRWKISSKKSAKSGGARVITFVKIEKKNIILLDVYDKNDKDTIEDKDIVRLLKKVAINDL